MHIKLNIPSGAFCRIERRIDYVQEAGTWQIQLMDALAAEHEKLSRQIQEIEAQRKDKADRRRRIEVFLCMLEEQEECMRFNPYTFVALVDKVVVGQDGKLDFCFRNGMNYTK